MKLEISPTLSQRTQQAIIRTVAQGIGNKKENDEFLLIFDPSHAFINEHKSLLPGLKKLFEGAVRFPGYRRWTEDAIKQLQIHGAKLSRSKNDLVVLKKKFLEPTASFTKRLLSLAASLDKTLSPPDFEYWREKILSHKF